MDVEKMIVRAEEPFVGKEENEFYFESDHLALKGNKDYTALLKTVVLLQAQRTQAIQDLDNLLDRKAKATGDPISFVAQLQNNGLPELPGPQKIAEIPFIDWTRYNVVSDMRMKPQTRHSNLLPQVQNKTEVEDGKVLVRGRAFDESKPETFNQLWTTEEQRRLEELLVEYPPEEVEMRRWTKIANALGNRTPKQVSSRVQKYFLKLLRAGLPIPGRGPKVKLDGKKSQSNRNQRNILLLSKKSTFFPHQDLSYGGSDEGKDNQAQEDSEDDYSNAGIEENPELRQIELLRQVKAEKEAGQSTDYQHFGYKCTVCGEDPLKGTRWHCLDCRNGVDLCADCAVAQLEAIRPVHSPLHKLTPVRSTLCPRSYDTDYCPENFDDSSYNYLDPNFLPE
ncbi:ZZ-type zinc finger-containing protein 3 [Venturia canescens]|uniref:ZZ-type zinc finger-containing protein 3 n=1 Tax=Venturia canescens TaxID=32260 RepID=UPI001C9D4288|nr:ZZ-type zinc finger-containing protein 3 [Venturia canescens]XP_043287117.1 ZZ-type zinc finger-containing protein 3 [Venturia canescens]XP_043287118.1 ZZ-type zinc finger-containing protein 3 [Venturia canescens]XP_043287119.1 ZZ-type zinc finger-containing protein 3 [Venturia canescens]